MLPWNGVFLSRVFCYSNSGVSYSKWSVFLLKVIPFGWVKGLRFDRLLWMRNFWPISFDKQSVIQSVQNPCLSIIISTHVFLYWNISIYVGRQYLKKTCQRRYLIDQYFWNSLQLPVGVGNSNYTDHVSRDKICKQDIDFCIRWMVTIIIIPTVPK